MTDGDSATLARIEAKLDALLARTERAVDPHVATFLRAVDQGWGNGSFRCGELLTWASDPAFAGRRAVLDAAAALIGAPVTAHRLGLRLAALAGTKADGLELVRVGAREHGARLWAIGRVQG